MIFYRQFVVIQYQIGIDGRQLSQSGACFLGSVVASGGCPVGRVILKLDNKNQNLFFCSYYYYVEFNSKQLLQFDQSPKMPRKLVKINFLFIKENIRKDEVNFHEF